MLATLLSICLSILLLWQEIAYKDTFVFPDTSLVVLLGGAGIFLLFPWLISKQKKANYKQVKQYSPVIASYYHQEIHSFFLQLCYTFFPLFSLFEALNPIQIPSINPSYLFCTWLIFFGFSIDRLLRYMKKTHAYNDPYFVLNAVETEGKKAIKSWNIDKAYPWIDALSEIAIKSLRRGELSYSKECIDNIYKLTLYYVEHQETSLLRNSDPEALEEKINFTLLYIMQRLELIFLQALADGMDTICSFILRIFAKLTIELTLIDPRLAVTTPQILGKLTETAFHEGSKDLALQGSCAIEETLKGIIQNIDQDQEIDVIDPCLGLIFALQHLSEEQFRANKLIEIGYLQAPFRNLLELVNSPYYAERKDLARVKSELERVIGQFEALALVMAKVPPNDMQDTDQEESSSNE